MKIKHNLFTNSAFIILFALISCFLWGSAFPAIKIGYDLFKISADDTYGTILFAGLRFALAGVLVGLICLLLKQNIRVTPKQLLYLACLGLLQTTLQYFFFYIGISNTTATNGSILSALATFLIVVISPLFFPADKLTLRKMIGVVLGLASIFVLNAGGATFAFGFFGEGFLLISGVVSALAAIMTKKLAKGIPPFAVSGFQLFIGGLVLTLIGLTGSGGKMIHFSMQGSALLVYMALISAVAFSLWTFLLKDNDVSRISIFKFSIPLFGALLSFFILGENSFSVQSVIALVLVITGIVLINTTGKKRSSLN